jgi:hypothetical protein
MTRRTTRTHTLQSYLTLVGAVLRRRRCSWPGRLLSAVALWLRGLWRPVCGSYYYIAWLVCCMLCGVMDILYMDMDMDDANDDALLLC